MAPSQAPKALLFDIGGVCVVSPFQAILDYENSLGIPPGWVNFSISRTSPNGSWHKLERGEVLLDAAWFAAFNADLRRPDLWRQHCALAASKFAYDLPSSVVSKLGSGQNAHTAAVSTGGANAIKQASVPPVPDIDGEKLFWKMMTISREPDPWMFPALKKLKAAGWFLAALSNTSIFPDGHPLKEVEPGKDVRTIFEVFVSSAHVGMRKPDPKIYELAMKLMQEKRPGLRPEEVVFTDDIGENVKQARNMGMRTIKVTLGKTMKAVKELEVITRMKLLDEEPSRL